jgi:hypothetical protein
MPIDVYSPCPGGTGKRIKFCCPDMLGELQKIERMIEGQQYQACLGHIERLEAKQPGRPCLLATKCILLRVVHRVDDAHQVAVEFLRLHPNNPVALAESAIMTAVTEGGKAAMGLLQQALAVAGQELPGRVYEMLGIVGQVLAMEGEVVAARAVLSLQALANADDPNPIDLLSRLNAAPSIPLWAKDERQLLECPADAPWRGEFEQALAPIRSCQWTAAAEQLAALAEKVGDRPAIWRNIATLRAWTADRPACIEALRKYAALDVPLDDAVEAEALALYFAEDPFGDQIDVFDLEYAVNDVGQLEILLASSGRIARIPVDTAAMAEEGDPPPKAVYAVDDRPLPRTAEGLTLESVPRTLCQAALYGRQTDREARLDVIGVNAPDLRQVKEILAETAGRELGAPAKEEAAERVSATRAMLEQRRRLPADLTQEQYRPLAEEHERNMLLDQWPKCPLGLLEGKSPEEAAGQEGCRVRLLAAVMLLEFWAESRGIGFDFNQLRARFALPLPEPIDPAKLPGDRLPLARLARVMDEQLSDDALLTEYRRASAMNAVAAMRKLARAVIDRPSLAGRTEYFRAFANLARLAEDSDQALDYVDRGRKAAEAAGQSCAPWDIMELSYRIQRTEGAEVGRLLQHLQTRHAREPGVASAVHEILVQYGLVRPDGTPSAPAAAAPQQAPDIVVPGSADAQPGELWTPDGGKPSGDRPKLWVPGMD